MDRRDFIKTAVGIAAVAGARPAPAQSAAPHPITIVGTSPENTTPGGVVTPTGPVTAKLAQNPAMKYRPFGNTGERLSMIGLGGFHLAKPGGPTAKEATDLVHAAIEGGVTFCDNCWDYNGGESETRLAEPRVPDDQDRRTHGEGGAAADRRIPQTPENRPSGFVAIPRNHPP
jgi:hypothetical protein